MAQPRICIAAYIDGKWHEEFYNTTDPAWRETYKILKDSTTKLKIIYLSK